MKTAMILLGVIYAAAPVWANGAAHEATAKEEFARRQQEQSGPAAKLNKKSAAGLQFRCRLVKTNFTVGEPVNVWCVATNTTAAPKHLLWHPSTGSHYCLVRGETNWSGGVLPLVIPHLPKPVQIQQWSESPQEYLLTLEPRTAVTLLLTYQPDRPERFKGRVVYDPSSGGGFAGSPEIQTGKAETCVASNIIEYEVTEAGKK